MIYRGLTLAVHLALGLLFTPLAAEAQQAVKVYRIGTLSVSSAERASPPIKAFEEGLRELGYERVRT